MYIASVPSTRCNHNTSLIELRRNMEKVMAAVAGKLWQGGGEVGDELFIRPSADRGVASMRKARGELGVEWLG